MGHSGIMSQCWEVTFEKDDIQIFKKNEFDKRYINKNTSLLLRLSWEQIIQGTKYYSGKMSLCTNFKCSFSSILNFLMYVISSNIEKK